MMKIDDHEHGYIYSEGSNNCGDIIIAVRCILFRNLIEVLG